MARMPFVLCLGSLTQGMSLMEWEEETMVSNAVTQYEGSVAMQVFGDDYAAIKSGIAPNLTDTELDYLASVARSMGLSVLRKQIYGTKRKSKDANGNWTDALTIQVGIDGYRVIADRTGKYAGQVGPYWCGEDGQWVDVWLAKTPPAAAKVGVLRKDFKGPLWSVAVYESYVARNRDGSPNNLWNKMPELMLAKCAESLALRKAFPDEMGGTYTEDEMQQADNPTGAPAPIREIRPASTHVEQPVRATVMNTPRTKPTQRGDLTERELLNRKLWARAIEYYGQADQSAKEQRDTAREALHQWAKVSFPDAVNEAGEPSIAALTDAQIAEMVTELETGIATEQAAADTGAMSEEGEGEHV
jgi:phage recombination protein Bet